MEDLSNYISKDLEHECFKNNTDPNLKNNYEDTSLIHVSTDFNISSNISPFKCLLKCGVNSNIQSYSNYTALIMVCRYSNVELSVEMLKFLLKYNIDLNL